MEQKLDLPNGWIRLELNGEPYKRNFNGDHEYYWIVYIQYGRPIGISGRGELYSLPTGPCDFGPMNHLHEVEEDWKISVFNLMKDLGYKVIGSSIKLQSDDEIYKLDLQ